MDNIIINCFEAISYYSDKSMYQTINNILYNDNDYYCDE